MLNSSYHGLVYFGRDGEQVPLSQIVEMFCGSQCMALAQKPKLFFFLAEQVTQNTVSTDAPPSIHQVMTTYLSFENCMLHRSIYYHVHFERFFINVYAPFD